MVVGWMHVKPPIRWVMPWVQWEYRNSNPMSGSEKVVKIPPMGYLLTPLRVCKCGLTNMNSYGQSEGQRVEPLFFRFSLTLAKLRSERNLRQNPCKFCLKIFWEVDCRKLRFKQHLWNQPILTCLVKCIVKKTEKLRAEIFDSVH